MVAVVRGAWEPTTDDVVVLTEGGQGRPEAARRGSLDGPVRGGRDHWGGQALRAWLECAVPGTRCAVCSSSHWCGCQVRPSSAA